MGKLINWGDIGRAGAVLGRRRGGNLFTDVESGKPPIRVRLVSFDPGDGQGEVLHVEVGSHFGLAYLGATEKYQKDGKWEVRKIEGLDCPNVLAQYTDPAVAEILRKQQEIRNYHASEEEKGKLLERCLFCFAAEEMMLGSEKGDRDLGYRIRAGRRYLLNAVLRTGQGDGEYVKLRVPGSVYEEMIKYIVDPAYAGRILDDEMAHEFLLSAEGTGKAKEYTVKILPTPAPLGKPAGAPINLRDPRWLQSTFRCHSLEEQRVIYSGGQIVRQREEEADSDAPPPPCFSRGLKSMANTQCVECGFQRRCDNPDAEAQAAPAATGSSLLAGLKAKLTGMPAPAAPRPTTPAALAPPPAPPLAPPPTPAPPALPPQPSVAEPDVSFAATELEQALAGHPWGYKDASDPAAFQAGEESLTEIKRLLLRETPEDGQAVWTKYAPVGMPYPFKAPAPVAVAATPPPPAPASPGAASILARIAAMKKS